MVLFESLREYPPMPVMPCIKNGIRGWKYGKNGKCYTGKDARKKAAAQGAAIKASQNK